MKASAENAMTLIQQVINGCSLKVQKNYVLIAMILTELTDGINIRIMLNQKKS